MANLKDGGYCFLGQLQPLDPKTKADAGARKYYALFVSVKNGLTEPEIVFGGPSDGLNECVTSLKTYKNERDTKRTFLGSKLTFEPPFDGEFRFHNRPCRLVAMTLRDIDKAQVYLGLI